MVGYLTPDSVPGTFQCRVLFLPDGEDWLAVITGAIQTLTEPENWTEWGALTPQQTADVWLPIWNDFCFRKGACKVIGEIVTFAGITNPYPTMWLDCDGASLLRSDYPDLFTVIGTTYGAVDGTHFTLPDLRGRAIVDAGTGGALTPRVLADSFGEETHTLTAAEMPSHTHTTGNSLLLGTSVPPPLDALGPNPFPAFTGSAGGDGAHNNMQPSLVLNVYIVAKQEL